jgi:hypothetical protein
MRQRKHLELPLSILVTQGTAPVRLCAQTAHAAFLFPTISTAFPGNGFAPRAVFKPAGRTAAPAAAGRPVSEAEGLMEKRTTLDRRGMLECMAWAGTAMIWTVAAGIPRARMVGSAEAAGSGFTFVQISDSHLGFDKPANPHTTETLQQALDAVSALPVRPAFMIHTGDISHLSKPVQFDTCQQMMRATRLTTYTVPGEHDILAEDGKSYLNRFGRGTKGDGWYSFDQSGVHFVGLVNVVNLQGNGLGNLGREQLEWLEADLAPLSASTPIVVMAHVPLWTVYEPWGWGTADGSQALLLLKRFGSVTVLNGHIHQVMQKIEGRVAFHTARSTAFPQPAPGTAKGPGPITVPAGTLGRHLGIARVSLVRGDAPLAIVDTPLT